jgi:hypothetical protein
MKKLWLGKLLVSSLTVGDVLLAAADQGPEAQTLRFARESGTRVRADQLARAVEPHACVEDPVSTELEDGFSVDPVDPRAGLGWGRSAPSELRSCTYILAIAYVSSLQAKPCRRAGGGMKGMRWIRASCLRIQARPQTGKRRGQNGPAPINPLIDLRYGSMLMVQV